MVRGKLLSLDSDLRKQVNICAGFVESLPPKEAQNGKKQRENLLVALYNVLSDELE